jgi:hypothetical protein
MEPDRAAAREITLHLHVVSRDGPLARQEIPPVPWPYHVTWQFCFGSVPARIFSRMPGSSSSLMRSLLS